MIITHREAILGAIIIAGIAVAALWRPSPASQVLSKRNP